MDLKISLATKRTCINMINKLFHLSSCSKGYDRDLFPFPVHRFDSLYAYMLSSQYFIYLLSLQDVKRVRRLVMVRVSWPGHPDYIKKK